MPNFLFFGEPQTADLSTAYGDSGRNKETVRPLLEIFRSYKFTLTENTPIEEEVALDPELLGHVFESLLAAYNPETGTIARKATGSFYTPRVVVDWMVDEALVVYLADRVPAASEAHLRELLSWERDTHDLPLRVLRACFERTYDVNHPLRAMLFSLRPASRSRRHTAALEVGAPSRRGDTRDRGPRFLDVCRSNATSAS